MKAHQEPEPPKPFRPVTLVLETQEELDAVYALLNHSTLRKAVGLPSGIASDVLAGFGADYGRLHIALCKIPGL
jgi:hypothetical protein